MSPRFGTPGHRFANTLQAHAWISAKAMVLNGFQAEAKAADS